jgi:hypothetical protein
MIVAPVVLFCYKRLDCLKLTLDSLKASPLAIQTHLIIFSDGPKSENDIRPVNNVREYLNDIDGFRVITKYFSDTNKGLANSVISGVSQVLDKYDRVIVLEDDLITSKNFLSFMNQALDHYQFNNRVFSIAGYTSDIKHGDPSKIYFTQRASSWGWATWRNRWDFIDWQVSDYLEFKNNIQSRRAFNRMGSDLSKMLDKQMSGKINSWAVRWCYHQFKYDLYTVFPQVSKVKNIGFANEGTHTNDRFNRFDTSLDNTGIISFDFPDDVHIDKTIFKQFYSKYSILTRIGYKILNSLVKK